MAVFGTVIHGLLEGFDLSFVQFYDLQFIAAIVAESAGIARARALHIENERQ